METALYNKLKFCEMCFHCNTGTVMGQHLLQDAISQETWRNETSLSSSLWWYGGSVEDSSFCLSDQAFEEEKGQLYQYL